MPGILGLIDLEGVFDDRMAHAVAALDLLSRRAPRWIGEADARMAVATVPDPPLSGPFGYEDGDMVGCFAGDLHDQEEIPWEDIARCTRAGTFEWTERVDGHFAVALYRKRERRLFLFADHFGCQPIFYARHGQGLVFSTHLGAFVRLGVGSGFDREWLYRFLFFGYSPGSGTFLEGVKRVPPGTVLCFDAASGKTSLASYEERFAPADPPLRGGEAIDKALAAFRGVLPRMFGNDRRVQIAFSGGIDSRTVCAFVPKGTDHAAFTYGVPGCADHEEAALVADRMGIRHRQLFFDDDYLRTLPSLVLESMWLSGGLSRVDRGMLPAVYRFAAAERGSFPVVASGMALKTLFRGRIGEDGGVGALFATGEAAFDDPAYEEILPEEELPRFRDTVSACVDDLTKEHGRLSEPASYLSYAVYTLLPNRFSAHLEIGGHYAALRIPGFDRAIVELAYSVEQSTIHFSNDLPRDPLDEYVLQASLVASHPRLARIPLHGIPLGAYVHRDKLRYHACRTVSRALRGLRSGLASPGAVDTENWQEWSRTVLASQTRAILNRGCIVADYVRPRALETYVNENRSSWLSRLATAEVILQLMANGWELSKLSYPGVRGCAVEADPFLMFSGAGGRS